MVSIAGLVLALAVAVVGNVTTLKVARENQIDSRHQSTEQFVRDQMVAAYSAFISAIDHFSAVDIQVFGVLDTACGRSVMTDLSASYNALRDAQNDVRLKRNTIKVIGSPTGIQIADDIVQITSRLYLDTIGYCQLLGDRKVSPRANEKAITSHVDLLNSQKAFVEAARSDLKIEDNSRSK